MRKRRFVYMGIIIVCFLLLALSISGLLEYTSYIKKEDQAVLREIIDESSKRKQRLTLESDIEAITQEIYGLYLPNYDKDGKEVSVIRGAYTVFLKNKIYKITRPEIELLDAGSKENNQPGNIVVTSDFGEMDKTTNKGFLYGNVIIRLEEDFKIYTDDLKYVPDEKKINTDGSVTIKSKGMEITGMGFEISLADSKAWVKNDPAMEVKGNRDDFSLFPEKKVATSNVNENIDENVDESIFIRSSGEMVFENEKRLVAFYDNVRVSRGKSTVFADELLIPFDSGMENVKKIIASGNVLASDGTKTAKGENLSWDTEKQVAILDDEPVAEFFDDKLSIAASRIKFFKDQGKMDIPVSGQLTTTVSVGSKESDEQDENKETMSIISSSSKNQDYESITITWSGSMSFRQDENHAIFKEDVIVNKKESKLYCGELMVTFDDENKGMQKLEAIRDVLFIEKRGNSFREARGERIVWFSTGKYIELYGNPLASVKDGERQISAPKISFSEDENKMSAEGKGNLLVKTHTEKEEESEFVDINWNDKMVYNGKNKTAVFYEMVNTVKGDDKLDCDRLDVLFHDKDKIKKVTASGNVYIKSPKLENTEGIGTSLIWDFSEDRAVLTGDPLAELRRSGARTFSEKIYFDMNTQRVHWEGKPHWQIYAEQR
jgi:LPS export ABC transporter protein LptC/lipopolysaccharide transport protein LptA